MPSNRKNPVVDYASTGRCESCYSNLDREGRLCRSCLRSRAWKVSLGFIVAAECAAGAMIWPRHDATPAPADFAGVNAGSAPVAQQSQSPTPAALVTQAAASSRFQGADARRQASAGGPVRLPADQGESRPTWAHFETHDEVLGDVTRHAQLSSSLLPVRFGQVVHQVVEATLELTRSAHYGDRVLLRLPHTRTACAANACGLRAWFDRSAAEQYDFAELPDEKQTILAVAESKRFAERLRGARRLVVVASLGTPKPVTMSFDVAGYTTAEAVIWRFAQAVVAADPTA